MCMWVEVGGGGGGCGGVDYEHIVMLPVQIKV